MHVEDENEGVGHMLMRLPVRPFGFWLKPLNAKRLQFVQDGEAPDE
jgi:hypothetical protein